VQVGVERSALHTSRIRWTFSGAERSSALRRLLPRRGGGCHGAQTYPLPSSPRSGAVFGIVELVEHRLRKRFPELLQDAVVADRDVLRRQADAKRDLLVRSPFDAPEHDDLAILLRERIERSPHETLPLLGDHVTHDSAS